MLFCYHGLQVACGANAIAKEKGERGRIMMWNNRDSGAVEKVLHWHDGGGFDVVGTVEQEKVSGLLRRKTVAIG